MTVYENASIFVANSFVKNYDHRLAQFTFDTEDANCISKLQSLANLHKSPAYLIREFVAVDADYQDQHPKKSAKDWYLLEVKPE